MKKFVYIILLLLLVSVISSCSTKKNTASSRFYQAFTTRYNVYFNGDEHYKETIKEMEKSYEDDYSSTLIYMHPAEAKADPKATQPTGDFTRSIEKAQKAIQLHSIKKRPKRKSGKGNDPKYRAWLKRDEYNPFLHNAWMMMGRSQYQNGDFLGAASTFYYTSKHFNWLPNTVTEAKLWQARSYCALGWLYEAENILTRIKQDELTSKKLRELYNFSFASLWIKSNENEKAIPYLIEAIKYAKGAQKTRLNFLLGQLYSLTGKKQEAYKAFGKAGSSANAPYRTKFNARIKQSEVYQGDNIEPEVKALKRMTRYDRNKEYLDQIYYAIGNLYLSRGDTIHAIENYVLAAEKSTRNGIDKAISQITLGELYFARHEYDKAQPCYSEAVPLLPESYPNRELLSRRSDVLDELAIYAQNVTLQDSLLRLSAMSEEERLEVINKIIDELKKKEKEEAEKAKKEEYLAEQAAKGDNIQSDNAPTTFTLNTDDSWYFYNNATRNAGRTDFQKRWGNRKLEDDWRRRNKASFDFTEFESSNEDDDEETETDDMESVEKPAEDTKEDKEKAQRENDPHYPEYYLKQIPQTDAERLNANDIIQEGYFNMGLILKDKLEDYPSAASEWNTLLERYPDNIYRLDVYYNMYLMYIRHGDTVKAEYYRQLILTDFAESKYGQAMRDPNYIDNLRAMDSQQESMYQKAYDAYLDNRNADVHAAYKDMKERFPMSKIMPKFMFIDALAYVTENKPNEFQASLKELLERYPDTDITPIASSYLKQLAQGRKINSGSGGNIRGMLWNIHLGNDSTASASGDSIMFDMNPSDPQLLIFVFPTDEVSSNQLLYNVARHNFTSYVVKDFDLEQMNFGRLGLLLVKGFNNFEEVVHYRKVLESDKNLNIPPQVRPVMISVKNFELLITQGRSFEEYFNFVEENTAAEAVRQAIPDDIFNRLPEEEAVDGEEPDLTSTKEPEPELEPIPTEQPSQHPETALPAPIENQKQAVTDTVPTDTISIPQPIVQPQNTPKAKLEAQQPTQQPAQQPAKPKEPAKAKTPATTPKPVELPEYPTGSEGDDPLLD